MGSVADLEYNCQRDMKVHFFGAAGEVTGSCFMVEHHETKILIDCGLFQGTQLADERSHAPFPFDPTTVSAVIVTHAHIDHCGRVPQLFARGFRGAVFASEPTGALIKLQWDDMLHIMTNQSKHGGSSMLYEAQDVARAVAAVSGVPYGRVVECAPQMKFILHDAGHILGSAWVELHVDDRTIVFSGDIGNDNVPIIRETEPLVACDLLVTEATYGDRVHASGASRAEQLRAVVIDAVKRGGALMIAAFSLERTQEILYELDRLIERDHALPRVPIFLDSPLAIDANEVYRHSVNYYDAAAAAEWKRGNDFFEFPGLHVTRTVTESKVINGTPNPKIIIAGSGMLSGGRITHHLMRYLADARSTLLFVSYQAEGTLGRKILEQSRSVSIHGEQIPVRCHLARIDSYSAHGDQEKLVRWIGSGPSRPSHVVVVHADPPAAAEFVQLVGARLRVPAEAARAGQVLEL